MNNLIFEWKEPTSLAAELQKPIDKISVGFQTHGWPIFLTLWQSDGSGMQVNSEMHDVAERIEIGVLRFSLNFTPKDDIKFIDVISPFDERIIASKLIIHESGTTAESGLALRTVNGDKELVIIPSASPYCLAIRGVLSSTPHIFEPEYPIDRYTYVPLG